MPALKGLGGIMRPELEDVAGEIIAEIRAAVPEYRGSLEGPYGRGIREGVRHAITLFVDRLGEPAAASTASRTSVASDGHEVHRRIGRRELREGRSLDTLQLAYRIGVRVAWRRIMLVGKRSGFSSAVMSQLADRMLALMDELSSVALDGYRAALAETSDPAVAARCRLIRLLLRTDGTARRGDHHGPHGHRDNHDELVELASRAGWPLPEIATPLALRGPVRAARDLPDEVLADLSGAAPCLLVAGAVTDDDVTALRDAVGGAAVGVGAGVEPTAAADSLRLARRALSLAGDGRVPAGDVVWAERVLPELLLRGGDAVTAQLRRRLFAPLAAMTERRRARTIETLRAWFDAQGSVHAVAERLGLHPQTVRHRVRRMEEAYGDRLRDPRARFELEAAVRSLPDWAPETSESVDLPDAVGR
ncbi:hypothetical protein BJF85_17510 [Saccharomonospora sp. CUA-673]|nr:hypothetical protein BJF85_17510 [Saccharomonospora sp. CUA-673]